MTMNKMNSNVSGKENISRSELNAIRSPQMSMGSNAMDFITHKAYSGNGERESNNDYALASSESATNTKWQQAQLGTLSRDSSLIDLAVLNTPEILESNHKLSTESIDIPLNDPVLFEMCKMIA